MVAHTPCNVGDGIPGELSEVVNSNARSVSVVMIIFARVPISKVIPSDQLHIRQGDLLTSNFAYVIKNMEQVGAILSHTIASHICT